MRCRQMLLAPLAAVGVVFAHHADVAGFHAGGKESTALSSPASHPRCFGAAARDPENPCENPRLRFSVRPSPRDAPLEPSEPCTTIRQARRMEVCAFGVATRAATATIALVGDSHAEHWRAALAVAA